MRRLIVHVGPHKTGSTSIQRALFFGSKDLLKLGIYYPSEWIAAENKWSHYVLFEQLRKKSFDSVKSAAASVLKSNANTIIVSAEDLSLLNVQELGVMAQAFFSVDPNLSVNIVFYVRRWSGLLPSVVQELIKHGVSSTLSDVVAQEMLAPEQSDTINYVNRLDRFSAAFGPDAINLIAFDNLGESKQNLVDHFFQNILGCARTKTDTYDVDTRHNSSISAIEVEFLRANNCLVRSGVLPKFAGDANEYLRRLRTANFQEFAEVMKGYVRELVIDDIASPFRPLYDALNAKYYRRFLNPAGPTLGDPLFRRVRQSVQYIHPNYVFDDGVLNSLIGLNQKIYAGTA